MPDDDQVHSINTQGGAHIDGDVNTGGGDFVGRDKIVHIKFPFSVWTGIAALIVCIAILVLFLRLGGGNFSYQVRVQREGTGEIIKDAKVIVEVSNSAPLSGYTGDDGYARLFIPADYVGKSGRLIVEVEGYGAYRSEINLYVDQLPTIVLLNTALPIVTVLPPTEQPREITDTNKVRMALISAGKFWMGSGDADKNAESNEMPQHLVYLDDFYIDVYEVTNALYRACVQAAVCSPPHDLSSSTHHSYYDDPIYDNYPVIYVDWKQARTYCEWRGTRLPTEAEWEKAARGADGGIYPWGNNTPTCSLANYYLCMGDTQFVGGYPAGANGLFDMAGNVWEWVEDWYSAIFYSISPDRNPIGPSSGTYHVIRGGSWNALNKDVRSAHRTRLKIGDSNFYIGFRCARWP